MGRSTTSSSKRKGGKVHDRGGLGGPGGRGGRRKTFRPSRGGVDVEGAVSSDMLRLDAREMAAAVKDRTARATDNRRATATDNRRGTASAATPYRTAMSAITAYANRHSKTMRPEVRAKLARAKDHLRELFGIHHEGKGTGGPGKKREKPKAQSRRNPRPPRIAKSARGGSHRASSK